ncbi:ERMES complex subunit [Cryptotrichosporon argae]
MLEAALNKGSKPPVIQGQIEVTELNMGTQPPTLTLLEIGDLSLDRFRGILRLGYAGDAWIEVRCRVQANPLSHNPNLLPSTLPISTPLLASQPLLVPMTLRLSLLRLQAILILVVSASKGITLVFKNDPLQNVDVSSTFDSVEVIRGYLQQEIEGQLREMFREDLPGIIHRLSQRWFAGSGVGGRVETPYRDAEPGVSSVAPGGADDDEDTETAPTTAIVTPRRRASRTIRERRLSTAASESPTSYTVFPDIEHYDPTYGLRPEGLPTHSGYEAFGRLWERAQEGKGRGLGSLMEGDVAGRGSDDDSGSGSGSGLGLDVGSPGRADDDGTDSFDMVELDDALAVAPTPSRAASSRAVSARRNRATSLDIVEWETFPAVGGGLVTRPRVYHAQSQIRAPSDAGGGGGGHMPSPSGTATATGGSVTARASSVGAASTVGSLRGLSGLAGLRVPVAGPSGLRRMTTERSDSFSSALPRVESTPALVYAHAHAHVHRPAPTPSRRSSLLPKPPLKQNPSWDARAATPARPARPIIASPTPVPRQRAPSIAGTSPGTNGAGALHAGSFPPRAGLAAITLPLNNSVSQLATLSHSNHTLSPYARAHEHIAVRSFPHLGRAGGGSSGASHAGSGAEVKARRKRIYRLGSKRAEAPAEVELIDGDGAIDDW